MSVRDKQKVKEHENVTLLYVYLFKVSTDNRDKTGGLNSKAATRLYTWVPQLNYG